MVVYLYACPSLSKCAWQGQRTDIAKHFAAQHAELLLETNEFRLLVPSYDDGSDVVGGRDPREFHYNINYLLHRNGEDYLVQVAVIGGNATIQIRYSGSAAGASAKRYSIQVRSGDMRITSNLPLKTFYPAVRNKPGMIEIDALFLWKAWKVEEYLICRIQFEELFPVECDKVTEDPPRPTLKVLKLSKSLEDFSTYNDLSSVENDDDDPIKRNSDGKRESGLVRSESEQSSMRPLRRHVNRGSKLLKRNSMYKKDQSLFYTNEEFTNSFEYDDIDAVLSGLDAKINTLKDFRCHNCEVNITGPIYRCTSEHSLCFSCMDLAGGCNCTAEVSAEQRSVILERSRDITRLKCQFDGCMTTHLGVNLQAHQIKCNHCVYQCPECNAWTGRHGDIEKHFKIVHPSVKRVTSLENLFPPKTCLLVMHPQGVFYCRSSEPEEIKGIDWYVENCGHVKIYFECEVFAKKNTYQLLSSKDRNIVKRSITFREKDKKQKSGVTLRIKVYKTT